MAALHLAKRAVLARAHNQPRAELPPGNLQIFRHALIVRFARKSNTCCPKIWQ